MHLITHKHDRWFHRLVGIEPKIDLVTTNMDRVALVIENNIESSVIDYLDSCLEASNASIDEGVVEDEEIEYTESKLAEVKVPEFHKDFI